MVGKLFYFYGKILFGIKLCLLAQKIQLQQLMKKKQQIILHKNLQCGKASAPLTRNQNYHLTSNGMNIQKNGEKQNKKVLSFQKNNLNKTRSKSKASNKQSGNIVLSIGKNQKSKSKRKAESLKGSNKSLKRLVQQNQNSAQSRKNIYTEGYKQKNSKPKIRLNNKPFGQPSSVYQSQKSNSIIESITASIRSSFQRLDVDQLVDEIQENEFTNLHRLKFHLLNFIFRNRIIRDQQFDRLYELMVLKFPEKEEIFKTVLFEIVSSLDN